MVYLYHDSIGKIGFELSNSVLMSNSQGKLVGIRLGSQDNLVQLDAHRLYFIEKKHHESPLVHLIDNAKDMAYEDMIIHGIMLSSRVFSFHRMAQHEVPLTNQEAMKEVHSICLSHYSLEQFLALTQ